MAGFQKDIYRRKPQLQYEKRLYGDTAQVGPEIAEHLNYPQVTCGLEVSVENNLVKVLKEGESGNQVIGVKSPCVITITKPSFEPRYPTIKSKSGAIQH